MHELRERADELLDRVAAGETITITRDGIPVAELRPLTTAKATLTDIIERRRGLPTFDLAELRAEMDAVIDPHL